MSIFVDKNTKVITQGMTGSTGSVHAVVRVIPPPPGARGSPRGFGA